MARIILAALMLAPVFSPAVGRALALPGPALEESCCCREAMAGMNEPAVPCGCAGEASCILMQEPPADLAAFLPSSPYRLFLQDWAGPGMVVSLALGGRVACLVAADAKPPPGPLFLLNHALLI